MTRCPVLIPALDIALHELALSDDAPDGEYELAASSREEGSARCAPLGPATGASAIELQVLGERLRVSHGVFFQANEALHEALVHAVVEAAGEGGDLLELFAGAGFFTLPLSRRFERVVAIESDPAAVADLRHNLERSGRDAVRVREERLEACLPDLPPADVLVLDPPRAGLPPGAAARLAALRPERIVYLSCDPATLARDCQQLVASRYALRSVHAFDLFPQTPHVEVLATLLARGR